MDTPKVNQDGHLLAGFGDIANLKTLVEEGSFDVHSKDQYGRSAIHSAARNGHTPIVTFLLEQGVDVNVQDGEGLTALIHATNANQEEK